MKDARNARKDEPQAPTLFEVVAYEIDLMFFAKHGSFVTVKTHMKRQTQGEPR
jgi:hypothetical protein